MRGGPGDARSIQMQNRNASAFEHTICNYVPYTTRICHIAWDYSSGRAPRVSRLGGNSTKHRAPGEGSRNLRHRSLIYVRQAVKTVSNVIFTDPRAGVVHDARREGPSHSTLWQVRRPRHHPGLQSELLQAYCDRKGGGVAGKSAKLVERARSHRAYLPLRDEDIPRPSYLRPFMYERTGDPRPIRKIDRRSHVTIRTMPRVGICPSCGLLSSGRCHA